MDKDLNQLQDLNLSNTVRLPASYLRPWGLRAVLVDLGPAVEGTAGLPALQALCLHAGPRARAKRAGVGCT